jgi:hypothetical protein
MFLRRPQHSTVLMLHAQLRARSLAPPHPGILADFEERVKFNFRCS